MILVIELLNRKKAKKRTTYVVRFFALLVGMGVLSVGVNAAESIEQRVNRMERMLENQNSMQILSTLQSLQREVSELRGDVEVLSFEMDKLKKQQKDIYLDLDQRIQQAEQSVVNLNAAPLGVKPDGVSLDAEPLDSFDAKGTLGEQESYQAALGVLKSGRYEDAILSFQVFLISYPESKFASNAQYWMSEAYYVLKDFQSAISQFQKVISAYPGSRKVADAHLKIGFAYYEIKEWANARSSLEKVVSDFSSSTAARLAQRRIQKMKLEGNI